MDITYRIHEITFRWDQRKALSNLRKHRVSFETACEVFFDPFLRVVAHREKDGEEREAVIGMSTDWHLLLVVFVSHPGAIRIVSARETTASERRRYEDQ